MLISFILIYICLVTPVRIAFVEGEDSFIFSIFGKVVDFIFFLDIILTFNMAYYDEDYVIVSDRKIIAGGYLRSWFILDLFAVIPFDLLT